MMFKRLFNFVIIAFWVLFGIYTIWAGIQKNGSILQISVGINNLLYGYFFLVRREGEPSPYPWYLQVAILWSIFLTYFYRFPNATPIIGLMISLLGSFLSIWSLFSLGKSFGVLPADRGLVSRGPYRFIRHPMYAGYLLIDIPLLIWNPSLWNWGIFLFKLISFIVRIRLEEDVILYYSEYEKKVRWRLIPFIW